MANISLLEPGEIALCRQLENGRIVQVALTQEQHQVVKLVLASLSRETSLIQMPEEHDLVLKSSLPKPRPEPTDNDLAEFLRDLAEEQYPHGDDFYAFKNKKRNWEFGSTNDEPLKFGNGYKNMLPDKIVKILYQKIYGKKL